MSLSRAALLACLLSLPLSLTAPDPARADVTLLIPSRTVIAAPEEKQEPEQPAAKTAKNAKADTGKATPQKADSGKEAAPAAPAEAATGGDAPAPAESADQPAPPPLNEEVDMLISLMSPREHAARPMDMPQLFAVLRHDAATRFVNGTPQPDRRDLLGDLEETLYLKTRAWAANVAIERPGLYQFITETRPRFDTGRRCFEQQYVKSILPVHGIEDGWERPAGLRLEILPLTRPFGLSAGAVFSGRAVGPEGPLAHARVYMDRVRTEKKPAPALWQHDLEGRTDSDGRFVLTPDAPGWWCCVVEVEGQPLKGPDGQPTPLILGSVLWLYVDAPAQTEKAR